jgi:glycosyltransferase involved in cell wall biosynthesis
MKISVIIPVYNEEKNIKPLYLELKEVFSASALDGEIIFVNDGSTDGTLSELKNLTGIKIINFRKNFGQTAAFDAGIKEAKGEIIVTLDGDGQNDPADIPKILEKLEKENLDVVSGWRWQRKDNLSKKILSRGANFLRRFFINDGIHDSGCSLKVYHKECFENLDLYGEIHRFIPGILRWQGFAVDEMKVNHRPRLTGKTKYDFSRTLKGFMDMLSVWFWRKYSARPIHLFGGIGFMIFAVGFLLISVLFVLRLLNLFSLVNSALPLVGFFMMLAGVQLFVSGLLADVILKNYYHTHQTTPYNIKEIIEK